MVQEFPDLTIPLERNQQGVIRVKGTRVSLDSILHAYFHDGATAEEIVMRFPPARSKTSTRSSPGPYTILSLSQTKIGRAHV